MHELEAESFSHVLTNQPDCKGLRRKEEVGRPRLTGPSIRGRFAGKLVTSELGQSVSLVPEHLFNISGSARHAA